MIPSRQTLIDGREAFVFDGALARSIDRRLSRAISSCRFTRTESARPDTTALLHWVAELAPSMLRQTPLGQVTERLLGATFPGERFRLQRTYCNSAQYGDMLIAHTDCRITCDDVTAVWFLCDDWKPNWGGELILYDRNHDAQLAVTPRPRRLVLFRGAILHAGIPPHRICHERRLTLTFKFRALASASPALPRRRRPSR